MPDTKISGLPDGGEPQDTDQIAAARGTAATNKITWANIRAWIEARFVTSGVTVDGDVQVGAAAPRGITSANFAGADVARLSQSNVFANGTQIVKPAAGIATWHLESADAYCILSLLPGNGTVDERRFYVQAGLGEWIVQPLTDGGAVVNEPLRFGHAGGMSIGAPTGGLPATSGFLNAEGLQVNGVNVGTGGVTNPLTAQLYSGTFDFVVGTSGASLGHLGDSAGVAVELVGSTDGGTTANIDALVRGDVVSLLGTTGAQVAGGTGVAAISGQSVTLESTFGSVAITGATGTVIGTIDPKGADTLDVVGGIYHNGNLVIDVGTAATIGEVGYDATPTAYAQATGTMTVSYTDNQFISVTGAGALTIAAPVDGSLGGQTLAIPTAVTVSLTGYVAANADPGGDRILELRTVAAGVHRAGWV